MNGLGVVRRGLCVAYGNCQVDDVRRVLAGLAPFTARFDVAEVAPVPLMTPDDAQRLRRDVAASVVVILQPIREDYRGLGIGSEAMAALAGGQVIRVASMYYRGVFPFQIDVSRPDGRHTAMPVSSYHDLRMLHCASRGYSLAEALRWWRRYRPDPGTLRALAVESLAEARRRERDDRIEIGIADLLEDRPHELAFNTVNHPARWLLDDVIDRVLERAGVPEARSAPYPADAVGGTDWLRAPIEPAVAEALGLVPSAAQEWIAGSDRWPLQEVLAVHLAEYRRRPELVALGLEQSAELMALLELDRVDATPEPATPRPIRRSRWSTHTRPPRALWMVNHQTLVRSEVPILRELGYEVFTPKVIPDDVRERSGSVTRDYDASLTIMARDLERLNAHDFYREPWDPELTEIINRDFEVAIVLSCGHTTPLHEFLNKYRGPIIVRAFGREHPATYTVFFDEGDPPLREVASALGERFVFGQVAEPLCEIEAPELARRARTLSLSLPPDTWDRAGQWTGGGDRALFVCPAILENGYYRGIYEHIKAQFGQLPHVIFGRQTGEIDDPAVLGYVSDEELADLFRRSPVFVYPSEEPRHLHYAPVEAMIAGMPVIYRAGTLLDRFTGCAGLPGVCTSSDEMRVKARALLDGDRELA